MIVYGKIILTTIIILAIIVWFILGVEDIEYGTYSHNHKKFRIVKYQTKKEKILYVIQYQLPITRRWKNEIEWIGMDYGVIKSYSTLEKAIEEYEKLVNTTHPDKLSKIKEVVFP